MSEHLKSVCLICGSWLWCGRPCKSTNLIIRPKSPHRIDTGAMIATNEVLAYPEVKLPPLTKPKRTWKKDPAKHREAQKRYAAKRRAK